jgi:DNA-binding XRE family transcriptional regulator
MAQRDLTSCPGERNGQVKLTLGQVAEIKQRYAAGGITQRELAQEFGVIRQTVNLIVNGKRWSRVAPIPVGGRR